MIVTTNNKLLNVTPVVQSDASVDGVATNMVDPDHSLTYTSGTNTTEFRVSMGSLVDISYVAISGHNAAIQSDATISIKDDGVLVQTVTISRNHNLFFSFDLRDFTDLQIVFDVTPTTKPTTVSFIAAGTYLEIPRGEQAGYSRQWLQRQITSQTTTNLMSAPTATTLKREALKGRLSIPNQTVDFIETLWQEFIDFSFDQPFFIKEDETKPQSSYICFDPKHDIKAHSQTRLLVDATMSFNAYNGL